jgi:hypothetical protein
MRGGYWHYAFWLLVIGSWVLGVVYERWGGGGSGIFADLGKAVSVPSPANLSWWQPILYFALTVVASFVLSQIFFGVGAAVFIFSRGVNDALLFKNIESMVVNLSLWDSTSIPFWSIFFIMLVLTVNLPLCLWASHLGTQRATRMLYRLRGRPLKSEVEAGPISNLLLAVAASLAAGLVATFALSYI